MVGLALFLVFLGVSLRLIWKAYRRTNDLEVLWAIGIVLIQLVAQQFSLDIYIGSLWAALLLPIGLGWWHHKGVSGAVSRRGSVSWGLRAPNLGGVLQAVEGTSRAKPAQGNQNSVS